MNLPIISARLLDGTVQVTAHGEIDLDNAYLIREAVDRALTVDRATTTDKAGDIVIDLARTTMIDSIGIGTLVACFHAASASGVRLRLTHPSAIVYRQLWVAGLAGLFGLLQPSAAGGQEDLVTAAP